jgi:hypothetical protein
VDQVVAVAPPRPRVRRQTAQAATVASTTPQDLALLFAALELELTSVAQDALTSGQLDTVRGRRRYQAAARSLIANIRPDARQRVRAMVEGAYGKGARLAGARPPGAVQRSTLDQLAQGLLVRLDGSLDTVGRQVDDVFRQVGLQHAARQLTRELPGEAAAELMRQELQQRGLTGFVDRAGKRWRLSSYSRMALVTTASQAQNRGVAEAMSAVGRDLVRINLPEGHAGCSHHASDPDSPCRKYEGQVLSLFGQTPRVPVLEELPPWHPFCEHFVAPAPEVVR